MQRQKYRPLRRTAIPIRHASTDISLRISVMFKICTPCHCTRVLHLCLHSTKPRFHPNCVVAAVNASKPEMSRSFAFSMSTPLRQHRLARLFSFHRREYCILHVLLHPYFDNINKERGPGSSVGIGTGRALSADEIFCLSRQTLGPTQPPVQCVPSPSGGLRRPGRWADPPHPHLECRGPRKIRFKPLLILRVFVVPQKRRENLPKQRTLSYF